MQQDVGIAEQQKVREQGRDGHIKQLLVSIQPPTHLFSLYTYYGKRWVVYLTVLCNHPYLFSLPFAVLLSLQLAIFYYLYGIAIGIIHQCEQLLILSVPLYLSITYLHTQLSLYSFPRCCGSSIGLEVLKEFDKGALVRYCHQ